MKAAMVGIIDDHGYDEGLIRRWCHINIMQVCTAILVSDSTEGSMKWQVFDFIDVYVHDMGRQCRHWR